MDLAPHGRYSLQSEPLLSGDEGTAQTIAYIRQLVDLGKKDPIVNRTTGEILRRGVAAYDELGEVRAIFKWVLRNIRFTKDPEGKECLRPARTTLEWGFGDCDDINAILLPSMLGTVGYRVRLVTISSHPGAPEQFSHVYCEVLLGNRWIPIDAARKGTQFGVEPARRFRKRIWSLIDDSFQDLAGLGCGSCNGNCAGCTMRRRTLGTHVRLDGLGRTYRTSLGQFDWSDFASVLNAAGNAAGTVIRSTLAPSVPVYPSMPGYPAPGAAVPAAVPPGGGVSAVGSISSNTMLLIGLGVVGVLLLTRRT